MTLTLCEGEVAAEAACWLTPELESCARCSPEVSSDQTGSLVEHLVGARVVAIVKV